METALRIGELARITGLPVKTIRFYSDRGLVPPVERSGGGYRIYDERALVQLELVRALRELGVGLDDIERVLARELDVRALVRMQIEAVEAQLRVLRLRRAALRAIDAGEYTEQELRKMTDLIRTSDDERKRVVEDFLDEVLGGLDVDPGLEERLRAAVPELPDDPSPEQTEAWVELAELCRDPGFRERIRAMAEGADAERRAGEAPGGDAVRAGAAVVAERGAAALAAGIEPGSPDAEPVVGEIVRSFGEADTPAARMRLADRFEQGADPRAERYWQLLAVINGWPPVPSTMQEWRWTIAALRAGRR